MMDVGIFYPKTILLMGVFAPSQHKYSLVNQSQGMESSLKFIETIQLFDVILLVITKGICGYQACK
jgi:hypothetical protein